jgi:hypothetical protein
MAWPSAITIRDFLGVLSKIRPCLGSHPALGPAVLPATKMVLWGLAEDLREFCQKPAHYAEFINDRAAEKVVPEQFNPLGKVHFVIFWVGINHFVQLPLRIFEVRERSGDAVINENSG